MPSAIPIPAKALRSTTNWNFDFDFDFSLRIQDTFPLARDPNRFLGHEAVSDISSPSTMPGSSPRGLTTVNVDVQNHIMSFMSTLDLSALMRTCRYFLDAALLPICSRSGDLLCDNDLTRIPSFRRFLRINGGPSSRTHLIKELWLSVADRAFKLGYDMHTYQCRHVSPDRKQWATAFLDILRHCRNIRRLRIDQWMGDISFPLLVYTITTSLHGLEDLTIYPEDAEITGLRKLGRLPLRRLSFLKYHDLDGIDSTPVASEFLPRSLTELDIHPQFPVNVPFPSVWKLGIRDTQSETFVAHATAAFPNVTHLILRRHDFEHDCASSRGREEDDNLRKRNKIQWRSQSSQWPSLSAIWAEDLCIPYHLGFSRQVPSLSIPFRRKKEEAYVAPVLTDTRPRFLELRINVDTCDFGSVAWPAHFGPSISSVLCLAVVMHAEDFADQLTRRHASNLLIQDELCLGILPLFTSLTHLLVRFERTYTSSSDADCSGLFKDGEARRLRTVIGDHEGLFKNACAESLRWIGFELQGWGLESYQVSYVRGDEESEDRAATVTWTKMSEGAGLATLRAERMNEFWDVRPSVATVY